MANCSFDFNKIKRSFMNVTLKDGRKFQVKMPMKRTFEKITALQNMDEENTAADEAFDTIAELTAEIISHNLKNERVTAQEIGDAYDLEEMQAFITEYYNFTSGGTVNNPN